MKHERKNELRDCCFQACFFFSYQNWKSSLAKSARQTYSVCVGVCVCVCQKQRRLARREQRARRRRAPFQREFALRLRNVAVQHLALVGHAAAHRELVRRRLRVAYVALAHQQRADSCEQPKDKTKNRFRMFTED